ncbi:MAG: GNAT family N-acetyltransferase [Thermotogae bacterium]|nr:GNAT family N-acetyltransferase [Thermotogota bacterium]
MRETINSVMLKNNVRLERAHILDVREIVQLIDEIFIDYLIPIKWREDEFLLDLKENSIDLSLSRAALLNGELIGILLLCNRYPISRIDVMGIKKKLRGKGIGGLLLNAVLTEEKKKGFEKMILEVISTDLKVIEFYTRYGFHRKRKLLSYIINIDIHQRENSDVSVIPAGFEETIHKARVFEQVRNWQRSLRSMELSRGRYNYSSFFDERGEGYIIWGKNRERGIFIVDIGGKEIDIDTFKSILIYLAQQNNARYVTMMNIPEGHFIIPLLKGLDARELFTQYEMSIALQR